MAQEVAPADSTKEADFLRATLLADFSERYEKAKAENGEMKTLYTQCKDYYKNASALYEQIVAKYPELTCFQVFVKLISAGLITVTVLQCEKTRVLFEAVQTKNEVPIPEQD